MMAPWPAPGAGRCWLGMRRGLCRARVGLAGAFVDGGEIKDHAERPARVLVVVLVVAVAFQYVEHVEDESPRETVVAAHAPFLRRWRRTGT